MEQYLIECEGEGLRSDARAVLPYSKSICNRVLTIQALSWMKDGQLDTAWCERLRLGQEAVGPQSDGICDDTRAMLDWLVRADRLDGQTLDIGAAGTAMRFSTALLSMLRTDCVLTGSARMKERPIGLLVDALRCLGADIQYTEREGFPPLRIRGGAMRGGAVTLAGNVSSQFISALLMVGPMLEEGLQLRLEGEIISRPYIDMTLREMQTAGAQVAWTTERDITVEPVPYRQSRTTFIERDWTAASYWYEVLALGGREGSVLTLQGLLEESTQGDRRVADIFGHLGVQTTFVPDEAKTVVLTKRGTPDERLDWDFVETPDLAQTVVVTCCLLGVPFHFTGLQSLRIKETDRIAALQNELRKLGFSIEADDRQMWWTGTAEPQIAQQTAAIDTYKDHRMAMAFAPAALRCGRIVLNDPLVVSKSYPAFWEELRQTGLNLTERRS